MCPTKAENRRTRALLESAFRFSVLEGRPGYIAIHIFQFVLVPAYYQKVRVEIGMELRRAKQLTLKGSDYGIHPRYFPKVDLPEPPLDDVALGHLLLYYREHPAGPFTPLVLKREEVRRLQLIKEASTRVRKRNVPATDKTVRTKKVIDPRLPTLRPLHVRMLEDLVVLASACGSKMPKRYVEAALWRYVGRKAKVFLTHLLDKRVLEAEQRYRYDDRTFYFNPSKGPFNVRAPTFDDRWRLGRSPLTLEDARKLIEDVDAKRAERAA